jgi:hypothetical protein
MTQIATIELPLSVTPDLKKRLRRIMRPSLICASFEDNIKSI